jgi:hypothetical protein
MTKRFAGVRKLLPILSFTLISLAAVAADNPFIGGWALMPHGGGAGWLGVKEVNGKIEASMMWIAGSVLPLDSAKIEGERLILTRHHEYEVKDPVGNKVKKTLIETITARLDGDVLRLTSTKPHQNGKGEEKSVFEGKRLPPMPPAPDLSKVKYGEPIQLFDGKNLEGWKLTDPNAVNAWVAKDGLLVNDAKQEEGKPHPNYGNLRTIREFEDFNIKLEVRIAPKGNSGVYLRGIYEVQVEDSFGQPLDPHHMGAVYSRITPTETAEKPAGEWQTMDITLVQRHVTVILNGKKIIDNQPVEGPTGGALWSDVMRPGPIYLQGDHTASEYRNIVLKPVVK